MYQLPWKVTQASDPESLNLISKGAIWALESERWRNLCCTVLVTFRLPRNVNCELGPDGQIAIIRNVGNHPSGEAVRISVI
jgi:hypothetical protein